MRSFQRFAALAAVLALAAGAEAKTLATGAFFYSGSVLIDTTCLLTNVGKKPSLGVYGGGRIGVRGGAKSLRGHCGFYDPAGSAVQVLELR